MKKNDRKSVSLRWLKNQLREEALKEKDEERKKKLWRWYYRAEDAEYEVDILVQKAEIRRLLEIAVEYGLIKRELLNWDIEVDTNDEDSETPSKAKKSKPNKKPPQGDDNLPKQKGFWD